MASSTVTSQLTYRLFEKDDLPGVLQLWERESGWGPLSAETWRKWYVDTPRGPCLVVVAEDEAGEIVGQEVFHPATIWLDGRLLPALRISAPILLRSLRRHTVRHPDHPIVQLLHLAADIGAAQGYSLMYSLPDHAWLPFFRWLPRLDLPQLVFQEAEYGCAGLALAPARQPAPGPEPLVAIPAISYGPEFDALWRTAVDTFPIRCGVVRDAGWVKYKNASHIALEVRDLRSGTLIGYSATRRQTSLLVDVLARHPDDLPAVIRAGARWLAEHGTDERGAALRELKVMATPALRPAIRSLGFEPIDYTFAFVCSRLDSALAAEEVAPERWYVLPGD